MYSFHRQGERIAKIWAWQIEGKGKGPSLTRQARLHPPYSASWPTAEAPLGHLAATGRASTLQSFNLGSPPPLLTLLTAKVLKFTGCSRPFYQSGEEDGWWASALREGSRYQIGWIFGKIPNGLWPPPHFWKIMLQIFYNGYGRIYAMRHRPDSIR